MKQSFRRVLALVGGAVLSIICAFAQVTTSSISGRISDSEGIVVGAAVITTHVPSGTTYYATTDRNGALSLLVVLTQLRLKCLDTEPQSSPKSMLLSERW